MKSLITLYQLTLQECGVRCATSTIRDFKTVTERFEHEGEAFLTITLPAFCSSFERSLDSGYVGHDAFPGFSRWRGLPRFLGGFLDQVFDQKTGLLLHEPSIPAIRSVRQLTLMFSKVRANRSRKGKSTVFCCTPEREAAAFSKFMECEQDVRQTDLVQASEPNGFDKFTRISGLLWADFLGKVDSRVYNQGVVPRHGPGATAEKLSGNAKYNQFTWTQRLERAHLYDWEHLIPSLRFIERIDRVTVLEPGAEIPVRVISVPKTMKTPRIIAIEPVCMQYMQQAVLAVMVDEVPRFDNARFFIDSKDQEPNQRLAMEGSLTGALATLDLSEASDRVSNQHVRLLLSRHRELNSMVQATRSLKADVPGHGIIPLAKFASMGSALTFFFEAMVFATVVFMGIESGLSRQLTKEDVKSLRGQVRVYGDDIIVPVDYVEDVVGSLESFGYRVNAKKSFWTGKFRESCGKEYYNGNDVTVARVRSAFPAHRQDAEALMATVALRNQLFWLGFDKPVAFLDRCIGRLIPFPYVEETSALLGRHAYTLPSQEGRHDSRLQTLMVKGTVAVPQLRENILDDYGALMKYFLRTEEKEPSDLIQGASPVSKEHLMRSGRPVSVRIKNRWASPR